MERRPIATVLGTGAFAGLCAGLATGAIDAIWSWAAAAQFLPGIASRLRFLLFTAIEHGFIGWLVGILTAVALLALSRATRLGDLYTFAIATHRKQREQGPEHAVVGLSLALAGLPIMAATLFVAYSTTMPFVANRHEMRLVVIVAIVATLVALGTGLVITFVAARPLEHLLAILAKRFPQLGSPLAPIVATAALIGLALIIWAKLEWQTVKILPLRGPLIALGFAALIPVVYRPALVLAARVHKVHFALVPIITFALTLIAGGNASVIKAEAAYTGLGGGIAHGIRKLFDRDHDGYSAVLGGGDCDDGDRTVHPGAPEIPGDGIDQNCMGGDTDGKPVIEPPAFAPVPDAVPKDFNVLLVTIDTLRADHLGMYGYTRPTSPNLDALAARGTLFQNGWAHAPSTRYSMPAILTGRLPLDVFYDMSVNWPGLLPKATTIAEYLAPLGFYTGAITNYEYFERFRHMDQGFVEYDNEDAHLHGAVAGKGPEETHGSSSKEQTDKAIAFVDKHADRRWMLWVHYYDPHAAYEHHPEVKSFGNADVDRYDEEIEFTDMHLGRLFKELRDKGLDDKTVIVVTGDHGEGFGEHGVFFHGYHLYSAQTKVPLLFKVPGMPPRKTETPGGHIDIIPTLLNLAGGQPAPDLMGRSLVDVIAGADTKRVIYQQLSFENNNEKRAGVDGTCHVIYNVSPDPSWEVYRVDRDPMEAHDLEGTGECADTRHAVEKWFDASTVPAGAAEALLPGLPAIANRLDISFDNKETLVAVDAPAHAKPGDTIDLTWTWIAGDALPESWRVFAHVESPQKQMTNADHAPARPFSWWKSGQIIRYTTHVTLPRTASTGTYTVWAGLFQGTTRMPRVTAPHAQIVDNAAAVAKIEVSP
ncbi:MAG: sulfatase-like hydrolase/transferase [Kofleriaceae bacterium]